MQRRYVDLGRFLFSQPVTEDPGSPGLELILPLLAPGSGPGQVLVRVHVELVGRLRHRLFALDGSQRHPGSGQGWALRLESRAVVPARSSRHGLSSFPAIMPIASRKAN